MRRRAWLLLCKASAYASTLGGDAQREEKKRLLQEAQRLLDERLRMHKDLARAVTHPATHHTAAASGAQEGEHTLADELIQVVGEKGKKGQKGSSSSSTCPARRRLGGGGPPARG